MKKYLLTAILTFIGFIGFSNADYSFVGDSDSYTPSSISLSSSLTIDSNFLSDLVYSCPGGYCSVLFSDGDLTCGVLDIGGNLMFISSVDNNPVSCVLPAGTYSVATDGELSAFSSFTFDIPSSGSGGGSSEGSDTLLSGGISQLSPVITSISTVMGEFIPYVVYIGIGILLCTLGFTAIKWLVNWFSRKITRYFK